MIKENGIVEEVIGHYLKGDNAIENHKTWNNPTITKGPFTLLEIGIRKVDCQFEDVIRMEDETIIQVKYHLSKDVDCFYTVFHIKNERGEKILTSTCREKIDVKHGSGYYEQTCHIPCRYLNYGNYSLDLHAMMDKKILLTEEDIISWTIVNESVKEGVWLGRVEGDILPDFDYIDKKISQ